MKELATQVFNPISASFLPAPNRWKGRDLRPVESYCTSLQPCSPSTCHQPDTDVVSKTVSQWPTKSTSHSKLRQITQIALPSNLHCTLGAWLQKYKDSKRTDNILPLLPSREDKKTSPGMNKWPGLFDLYITAGA